MPQCCSCQSFLKRISLFTTISYLALICCPPGNWDVETGSQTPSSSSLPSSNRNPGSPWRLGCRWRNTTSHLWDVADIWRLHIEHTFYPFKLVWEDFLLWILTFLSNEMEDIFVSILCCSYAEFGQIIMGIGDIQSNHPKMCYLSRWLYVLLLATHRGQH